MTTEMWTVTAAIVPLGTTSTTPISLLNLGVLPAGTSVLRVYRMWLFAGNTFGTAQNGLNFFTIATYSCQFGSVSLIQPRPYRTTNLTLSGVVASSLENNIANTGVLRRFIRDIAGLGTATNFFQLDQVRNWEYDVPFAMVFEAGALDTNVQPITLRPGYGVHITQSTAAGAGAGGQHVDAEFEFSNASS